MIPDNMKFVDTVISIPKNTVSITLQAKVYENGELKDIIAEFDLEDIREMIDLFEQTIAGTYPKYVLTDIGKQMVER